ncbi:hypothetical protein [Devosia sp.]|uniref:hypothetical protein n=1 Tax=Devosia sp. TaxID=1871048 RepID=UPI003F6F5688
MIDRGQLTRTEAFALLCKTDRDQVYRMHSDPNGDTAVAQAIRRADLTEEQRQKVLEALDVALTDAYYGILLALDGAASLGDEQQSYTLLNEHGEVVSDGSGHLESYAYEAFYGSS